MGEECGPDGGSLSSPDTSARHRLATNSVANATQTTIRRLVTLGLAVLLASASLWLVRDPGAAVVRASYDLTHMAGTWGTQAPTNLPVLLVYLDAASYAAEDQDPTRPWSRALHARLLDRLTRAGARAVVFDVVFDRPASAAADARFRDAIQSNGRVVLAAELAPSSHAPGLTPGIRSHTLTQPTPAFSAAAAAWGLADLTPDSDFVVRRHFIGFEPNREPALAWATARWLQLPGLDRLASPPWLRYYGPPLSLPHVSYTHALDPNATPDAVFSNRVVFIGARPVTGGFTERRDEFRNPLAAPAEDLFMPAVEVHATQFLNLLRADWLRRCPPRVEQAVLLLSACGLAWFLLRWRPWTGAVAAAALELGLLVAVGLGFQQGVWGAWLAMAGVQIPGALGISLLFHSLEWYQTRRRLIAERRLTQAQLERAQRLQAIWSLASGMAHDLNHALAPVLLGVQRLRKLIVDPDAQTTLAAIEASARRGAEMVRQVLVFARGPAETQDLLNPGQLLHEIERLVSQTFPREIRLTVLAPPDLWPVLGNPTQLQQVLLNLCLNARDAMPEGGELTLAADNLRLEAADVGDIPGAVPGEYVMLLVADTGTGIDPDLRPHLFEPFVTSKPPGQGTGLGLSTSAQIVRAHAGFINVRSEPAAGATFEVYLPRATVRPAASPEPTPPIVAGTRLLLIQPESAVRGLVQSTLEAHGYRVDLACDSPTGLEVLADNSTTFHAVLLDSDLPHTEVSTTGRAIRERYPSLPIVVLGGDPAAVGAAPPHWATRTLPKPFQAADLLDALRRSNA